MVKSSGGSGRSTSGIIRTLTRRGYTLEASENRFRGVLDKENPIVYNIRLANGASIASNILPAELGKFVRERSKNPKPKRSTSPKAKTESASERTERLQKARDWDRTYNEGGEGFNPYR